MGQDERALALLDDERDPMGATLLRGDIFRAQGKQDEALEALNYRDVRIANPTDQAWSQLAPPPLGRVDVGSGLDLGYVRGMHLNEQDPDGTTYRWTQGRSEIRLTSPGEGRALRLRLRGYHPNGTQPVVSVSVNGNSVGTITTQAAWVVETLSVEIPAGEAVVRLETTTFVPGYADQRRLGFMLDWIELATSGR
jgi:hypothetical protein